MVISTTPDMITEKMCEKWKKNPLVNPITGTKISPRGKVYKMFEEKCSVKKSGKKSKRPNEKDCQDWKKKPLVNPITNRKIQAGKGVFLKLQKDCGKPEMDIPVRKISKKECDEWFKTPTVNPLTKRKIKLGKATYLQLEKDCGKPEIDAQIRSPRRTPVVSPMRPRLSLNDMKENLAMLVKSKIEQGADLDTMFELMDEVSNAETKEELEEIKEKIENVSVEPSESFDYEELEVKTKEAEKQIQELEESVLSSAQKNELSNIKKRLQKSKTLKEVNEVIELINVFYEFVQEEAKIQPEERESEEEMKKPEIDEEDLTEEEKRKVNEMKLEYQKAKTKKDKERIQNTFDDFVRFVKERMSFSLISKLEEQIEKIQEAENIQEVEEIKDETVEMLRRSPIRGIKSEIVELEELLPAVIQSPVKVGKIKEGIIEVLTEIQNKAEKEEEVEKISELQSLFRKKKQEEETEEGRKEQYLRGKKQKRKITGIQALFRQKQEQEQLGEKQKIEQIQAMYRQKQEEEGEKMKESDLSSCRTKAYQLLFIKNVLKMFLKKITNKKYQDKLLKLKLNPTFSDFIKKQLDIDDLSKRFKKWKFLVNEIDKIKELDNYENWTTKEIKIKNICDRLSDIVDELNLKEAEQMTAFEMIYNSFEPKDKKEIGIEYNYKKFYGFQKI